MSQAPGGASDPAGGLWETRHRPLSWQGGVWGQHERQRWHRESEHRSNVEYGIHNGLTSLHWSETVCWCERKWKMRQNLGWNKSPKASHLVQAGPLLIKTFAGKLFYSLFFWNNMFLSRHQKIGKADNEEHAWWGGWQTMVLSCTPLSPHCPPHIVAASFALIWHYGMHTYCSACI